MSFSMLYLEKLNLQIIFAPPHKDLDPICGPIDNFAENLRPVEDHLDCTSIQTTNCGTSTAVTSLATVNTIVDKIG